MLRLNAIYLNFFKFNFELDSNFEDFAFSFIVLYLGFIFYVYSRNEAALLFPDY